MPEPILGLAGCWGFQNKPILVKSWFLDEIFLYYPTLTGLMNFKKVPVIYILIYNYFGFKGGRGSRIIKLK